MMHCDSNKSCSEQQRLKHPSALSHCPAPGKGVLVYGGVDALQHADESGDDETALLLGHADEAYLTVLDQQTTPST